MKKILFSVVCLMMVSIQSVKAQIGLAVLHHAGKVTVFAEDKLANAITASVEGDTIYLSEGHFLGDITIDKAIHLIGSGQGTIIDGSITISIDNTPTLTGYLLTGMHIIGNIIPEKSLSGLRISQCFFIQFGVDRNEIKITDLYVDRSYCRDWFYLNEIEESNVYGSKIGGVQCNNNSAGRTTLNHCNINGSVNYGGIGYLCINCIMSFTLSEPNYFQNCLSWGSFWTASTENCWHRTDVGFDEELNCSMSDEELQTNGYLATDGTVIGITGGDAPFTLNLATPKVLEHNIVVDKDTKKLNVTLRVGNE